MKKLLSLALALMMVLSLATTALADEPVDGSGTAVPAPTYTITINNAETDHTYDAYQIFSGDLHNGVLSNIEWGTGVADGTALLTALKADTYEFKMNYKDTNGSTQTKTTTLAAELANAQDAADVAVFLTSLSDDSFGLDRFAEIVGAYSTTTSKHIYLAETPNKTVENAADGKYVFTGLEAGYYLIKDRDGSQEGMHDFYTKYILRVTKNQSVNVKGEPVKIDKLIGTALNGDYTDWKDFDIKDTAYYKLIATVPNNYDNYQRFMYRFTDTLPTGITFNRVESITVRNKTNHADILTTLYTAPASGAPSGNATLLTKPNADGTKTVSIKQTIDGQKVVIELEDMKVLVPNMTSNYEVVVDYSATVNAEVVISEYGSVNLNTNSVYLEYTNNPNGVGTGKTEKDIAHALTFTIKLNKLVKDAEKDDMSAKLAGAEFIIYYREAYNKEDGTPATRNWYAVTETKADGKQVLVRYTENRAEASTFTTDAQGNAALYGVDSGDYWLEEIKAPAGYNLLDAPVQVSIAPTIVLKPDGTLDETASKVDVSIDGHASTDGIAFIENSAGSTLPETGGMGTTLFYVLGTIMVLGAAVMLITKKRMAV